MKICLACELENSTDNDYCMKCQSKSEFRCKECTSIVSEGEDTCEFCKRNTKIKQTYRCVSCNKRIPKQTRQYFVYSGNWCRRCLGEVTAKLKQQSLDITSKEVLEW